MDVDELRALIRAAVLAVPLAACGGDPAPPPEPGPQVVLTPTEPEGPSGPSPTAQGETQGGESTDGTMTPEEFDRQWRQSLDHRTGREPTQPMMIEGRPLTTLLGAARAPIVAGGGWGNASADRDADPRIAALWLVAAQNEHASVASFARAVLELSAVGAPSQLLADHLRAGLDEVEHARACFALAARYGAVGQAPGALPVPDMRPASVPQLAADVFVEGCVNETIAALAAQRASAVCEDPETRTTLSRIADDEVCHAALAWQTLRWAIEADPRARDAIARVVLPEPPSDAPADPVLRAHGLLDDAAIAKATRDAVERVIRPLRDELLS